MADRVPRLVPFPRSPYSDPIPGIIPFGTTTLLAGPSQLGKTAMIASWAVRFKEGRSICGHPVNQPNNIGVLVVDRQCHSHVEWFTRAGWGDIPMYSYRDDPKTKWEDFLQRPMLKGLLLHGLEQLEKHHDVARGSLIIIDPISPFIAGNLIDYKHTLVGLGVIDQLAKERNVTILGIAHMGKQKGEKDRYTRPQDRILGSAALGGFTDTQIYMLGPEDTDHGHYELGWIPHNAPAEEFKFNRDDNGLFIPAPRTAEEGSAEAGILGLLKLSLNTDPTLPYIYSSMTTKELVARVMEDFGAAERTIKGALARLSAGGKIERRRHGFYALNGSVR